MSNTPHGNAKKRRGPYKRYLDRNNSMESSADDGIIPRTTAFEKRKRFSEVFDTVQAIDGAARADVVRAVQNISSCCMNNPTTHQDSHYQTENITDLQDSANETDNRTDNESYIVGRHDFQYSPIFDQRTSEDIEGVDTYSVFENQCLRTSSEIGSILDDDHPAQYREEINDNCPAEDVQNGGSVDDLQDTEYFSERLCQCTATNRGEAIMAVLTLAIRHSFTWVGVVDTLKTINALFGKNVVPATKYKLFKYFATQSDYFRYHIICPKCETLMGKQSRVSERETRLCKCGHEVKVAEMESFFLSAGFAKQLRTVLQIPEVSQNINYRHTRYIPDDGDLTDIYDGKIYKSLSAEGQPLSSAYNLSYTFNTDGCQASNSSATSLWPIYVTINELPPHLRSKHIILVGIWACQRKPEMTSFLQPFVEDARALSSKGITWETDGREVVTSKVFAICSSVDSVARSAMLNMKQFNGYYGCTMCEHPGELIQDDKTGRKTVKYAVSTHVPPDRTHESIVNNMKLAYNITKENEQSTSVKGIFGPSPLMNLMHFDLSQGLPPDSMHLIAGLMKQYTNTIVTDVGKEYYVGAPNILN